MILIVKWLVGLRSLEALPIEAALNLFITGPPLTYASLMINSAKSKDSLLFLTVKFATADLIVHSINLEAFSFEK